jgi:hypothetical protein
MALEHVRAIDRAKRNYRKADERLAELLVEVEPGRVFDLGKRGKFVLKDEFAGGKNKAFRTTHFQRYSLEMVK